MVVKKSRACLVWVLMAAGVASAVVTGLNPLPGHMFIHQEAFEGASAAGWDLAPTFVPYPHAPTWKTPKPTAIDHGLLGSAAPGEGGAAMFDVTTIVDPDVSLFGLNLGAGSYAFYMRLWQWDNSSKDVATVLGFMNFAAEGAAPDVDLAKYVSGYVRNKRSTQTGDMVSWGGKNDMDNPADGADPGLSATSHNPTGMWDYAFLFEGNGTSIVASAFLKATDTAEWTPIVSSTGVTSVDTGLNFYSRNIFLWSRYSEGWAIEEFAVSRIPEPATITLLALGGLAFLRRRK